MTREGFMADDKQNESNKKEEDFNVHLFGRTSKKPSVRVAYIIFAVFGIVAILAPFGIIL